jgi:methionyl aminopeptidase
MTHMSADTPQDVEGLRRAGRVVAQALRRMKAAVRAGVTTAELDDIAAQVFAEHGARSGPRLDYDFPGATCISVNAEAVHGIPGPRRLRDGDLVTLDVTAELDGYYADAAMTVPVGRAKPSQARLAGAATAALAKGLEAARAGNHVSDIGAAVQAEVERRGFHVLADLTGHGIGRRIHEPPTIWNVADPPVDAPLTEGLVITVEPIIAASTGAVVQGDDGWTILTADGSTAAHAEHTLVVTQGRPLLMTA